MKKILWTLLSCGLTAIALYAADAPTPAEVSIGKAEEQIAKSPDHVPYYASLAMAYARRARETSDTIFYKKASETLDHATALAKNNPQSSFELDKVRAWLLLGNHEFAQALQLATRLNAQFPDDVTVYGYLSDANAELGNYDAAVDAAQWMLRLRPGNIAGLTRAAYQRELHGDLSGSIDLMKMAYDATSSSEVEDRAWLLTQIAHVHLLAGEVKAAEQYATGALGLFPSYHYALGTLAQVRAAQGRDQEAVDLLRARYQAAPHAENLFALAQALEKVGNQQEAASDYAKFETAALLESVRTDNANHELIAYYLDVAHDASKGLKIAELEYGRRHDVHTLSWLAWARQANGDTAGAQSAARQSLAIGIVDPVVLQHAAAILHQPDLVHRAAR